MNNDSQRELALRIEGIEAAVLRAYAENAQRRHPEYGAVWEPIAGGTMAYCGPDSLMNEAKAFGMVESVSDAEIERLERFFLDRDLPARSVLTPFSAPGLAERMAAYGHLPGEFESMLYQSLIGLSLSSAYIDPRREIRPARAEERKIWSSILVRCFFPGGHELSEGMTGFADASFDAEGLTPYLVFRDGEPAGAGSMSIFGGTALLAGSGTLPEFRGRGLHAAFIARRLHDAAAAGCDLAVYSAQPGSVSQANAERQGFRLAYSRITMVRKPE